LSLKLKFVTWNVTCLCALAVNVYWIFWPTTETVAFTGFPLVSAPPDTVLACAATGAMIPSTGTRARRKIHRFMA